MKKSWRTTLSGVIGGLVILLSQGMTLLDDDPKTNPDYPTIVGAISMIALGINARDETVTSEQVLGK